MVNKVQQSVCQFKSIACHSEGDRPFVFAVRRSRGGLKEKLAHWSSGRAFESAYWAAFLAFFACRFSFSDNVGFSFSSFPAS
jgi:hypothetical protein